VFEDTPTRSEPHARPAGDVNSRNKGGQFEFRLSGQGAERRPARELVASFANLAGVEGLRDSPEERGVGVVTLAISEYDTFLLPTPRSRCGARCDRSTETAVARVLAGLWLAPSAFAAAMEVAGRARAWWRRDMT
jgi:hypothetical protein